MGQASWGNTDVPLETRSLFGLYQGFETLGDPDNEIAPVWGTTPLYPTYNMREAIQDAWATSSHASPYENVVLHDPNPDIDDAIARYEEYEDVITAMVPKDDWADIVESVATTIDATVTWTDSIEDLVTAFDNAHSPERQRAQARMDASLASINVGDTAWFMGKALIENAHLQSVSAYRANLNMQAQQQRRQMILNGVTQVMAFVTLLHDAHRAAIQVRTGLSQMNITANNDLIANMLNLDIQAENWNIGLLGKVKTADFIGGAPVVGGGQPAWVNTVGAIGSIIGGVATAAAGIMGGVAALAPVMGWGDSSSESTKSASSLSYMNARLQNASNTATGSTDSTTLLGSRLNNITGI